jgi:hypothetical protein
MSRLKYLVDKLSKAWSSGTLQEKGFRFLHNQARRYVSIPLRSSFQSTSLSLDLDAGFKDHRDSGGQDIISPDQITRIIKAYKTAKLHQPNAGVEFEIKGLWEEWIAVNFKDLITNLQNENSDALGKLFNNLIREQCTIGLGGHDEWVRYNALFGKSYIRTVWLDYYRKLVDLQGKKELHFPMVGNPCGIVFEDRIIPIESLRHAYRAQEIANCLKGSPSKTIVEIGGGYGGLGYQVAATQKDAQFILFDIPEVAAISSAFLLTSFPIKKIRLYGEGPITGSKQDYEIGIFPNFSIDQLADQSVDLFYNSCSFSEMDEVSSSKYLSVIERCTRQFFMHDNHETRFTFAQPDGTVSKNRVGSELLPNPKSFKLLYKKQRTHGLPEDASFRHFEYLYERL